MSANETCWTLIRAVHHGDHAAREEFVKRYLSPVRAFLRARWREGPLVSECDDAVQEVFVRCFADSGPLDRITGKNLPGFRSYLIGVCRNVAREMEQRRGRMDLNGYDHSHVPGREERLSEAFDRALAQQVMKEARERFRVCSKAGNEAAQRRFELLRMRFEENVPIRTIATRWGQDAAQVHKEYARARKDYRKALLEVVAEHNPGRTPSEVEETARLLLEALQ